MKLDRAARAYEDFTGHEATEVTEYKLPDRDIAGWVLGPATMIGYSAVKDGEYDEYLHEFDQRAAPVLVAGEDGRSLFLANGNIRVTDHGIEDFDMPALMAVNPHKRGNSKQRVQPMRKRKKRAASKTRKAATVTVQSNPKRRKRSRKPVTRIIVRRNPSGRGKGGLDLVGLLVPSAVQAVGAVGASIGTALLPLPAASKTGVQGTALKIGVGLAGGFALAKFVNKSIGQNFASGAIVIALVDLIKQAIPSSIPMAGFIGNPDLNGFVAAPNFSGADDGGMWIDANTGMPMSPQEVANMGMYTASMVSPDQDMSFINR